MLYGTSNPGGHLTSCSDYKEISVTTAKQRRSECLQIKDEMIKYRVTKEKHLELNKADRIIKSEWKYGVLGQPEFLDTV